MSATHYVVGGAEEHAAHLRLTCRGGFATRYMTPAGKNLKEQYQWEAKAQWRGGALSGPVSLSACFYSGSRRKRDLDNQNKQILDVLTGIAYEDDAK